MTVDSVLRALVVLCPHGGSVKATKIGELMGITASEVGERMATWSRVGAVRKTWAGWTLVRVVLPSRYQNKQRRAEIRAQREAEWLPSFANLFDFDALISSMGRSPSGGRGGPHSAGRTVSGMESRSLEKSGNGVGGESRLTTRRREETRGAQPDSRERPAPKGTP